MTLSIAAEPVPLTPDASGVLRVADSRISLESLIAAFLTGATAEEIAQQYPTLKLGDIYAVLGYYLRHQTEVETYLTQEAQKATEVRAQIEAHQNPAGIRARLQARQNLH